MSSSYRGGVPSSRRSAATPAGSSMLYGGRPRSLGLYSNNPVSSYLSGTSPMSSYLSSGSPLSPSYLSGSPTSYLSGSPKNSSYLSGSPKNSSYLSGSPKSASYLSGSPMYLSGGPKSSSYLSSGGYGSGLSLSTYGGTTSGYGGLTLASMAPYSSRSSAALPTRSSSFNLNRSPRSALQSSPLSSGLSSRAGSWASLAPSSRSGSEGYASGGDLPGQSSRLGNSPSTPAARASKDVSNENGEIDYKKLYEASMVENERLREKLKKTEGDLNDAKSQLDKTTTPTKNSLSEIEKRERRAMERKLSEMEEELKQLQKLKAENERLKAENRALTRVVSKLTNSANATK